MATTWSFKLVRVPAVRFETRRTKHSHPRSSVTPSGSTTGSATEQTETTIVLPRGSGIAEGSDRFLLAELYSLHDDHPMWNRRVGVYLRSQGDTFEVVGIERESDPPDNIM